MILNEIHPLQLSKASAEGHAEILSNLVKDGEVAPLDMATRLRYIMNVCEQTLKDISGECVSEAFDWGKEKIVVNDAHISIAETGTKYDYEGTGDPEWNHLANTISHLAEQKKKRETFLKALTGPEIMKIDNKEVHISPPRKTSSTSIKISFNE